MFEKPDPSILASLTAISTWASASGYEAAAVTTFLGIADYYLVAYAHAHRHTAVTHEKVAHSAKKIKIPDACIGNGIKCVTPFEMLRTLHARFVLGR